MRGRLSAVAAGIASTAILLVASGAEAQTPDGPPTHGELLPGGAEVGADNHQFNPGDGRTEIPPSGYNTSRECWLEYGEGGEQARRVSLAELQGAYERFQAAGGDKLPARRVCQDIGGGNPVATPYPWPPDGDEDVVVPPEALRDMARNRLWYPPPVGDMSPTLSTGTFAQLPSYYWVTNAAPGPTARAEAGPYWAEVTATVGSQTWVVEDAVTGRSSEQFSCDGAGVPFDPTSGLAAPADACPPWEPAHSSAGQSERHPETVEPCFEAIVTVTWNVSWETNAPGVVDGFLGTDTSAARTCIVVQELQAVVSSDGDG